MPRLQKHPLRSLTADDARSLETINRSQTRAAGLVARAKELLAVADGLPTLRALLAGAVAMRSSSSSSPWPSRSSGSPSSAHWLGHIPSRRRMDLLA
jgi:hypothetical protein